jgi:hypothetical protein
MNTRTKLVACIYAAFVLLGCEHSLQEGQLVGSWQLDIHVADARVTYYADHTWAMTLTSSNTDIPSSSEFGDWKLQGNRLVTNTRSTLDNIATNMLETATIVKLDGSVLVWKVQDQSGHSKTSTLHRTDMAAAPVTDADFTRRLVGTWIFSFTNSDKLTGALLYSSYRADGSTSWRGTVYRESRSQEMPKATGVWRVQEGHLSTTITNSQQSNLLPIGKESRDEIISVTGSQFTYRDDQGTIYKVVRAQ